VPPEADWFPDDLESFPNDWLAASEQACSVVPRAADSFPDDLESAPDDSPAVSPQACSVAPPGADWFPDDLDSAPNDSELFPDDCWAESVAGDYSAELALAGSLQLVAHSQPEDCRAGSPVDSRPEVAPVARHCRAGFPDAQ